MVSADRVLLQHPVWDSGFALRHVFLHPHLLHLLWMSRLKVGRSVVRSTQLEGRHVKKAIIHGLANSKVKVKKLQAVRVLTTIDEGS